MKICVIGYSGGGKSTLAKALGEHYHCDVLYLDTVQFLPGWQERALEESVALVEKFLEKDAWVIDGNYRRFLEERRLEEADRIIFLNLNRLTCFFRALRRHHTYRGRSRESMTEGCEEKMDWEFIRWLLWDGRKKPRRERFGDIVRQYPEKTVVLRSPKEIDRYLASLGRS